MKFCISQYQYKRDDIFAQIPSDLIHQIIFYYTNTYQGLYLLRTINKEWKLLAESSLIWISCKLILACPKDFLRPLTNLPEYRTRSLEYLQRVIGAAVYSIYVHHIDLFALKSDQDDTTSACFIICDENHERGIWDPQLSGNFQEFHDSEPLLNKMDTNPSNSTFERCQKIFKWFHFLHGRYVRMWNHRITYVTRYYNLRDWMIKHFEKFVISCLIASILLIILSMYGWYTLERNIKREYFAWENHLSFTCLNLSFLIDFGLTTLDSINELCYLFKMSSSLNVSFWDYSYIILVSVLFLSSTVFLSLTHTILVQITSGSTDLLPWRVLLGPVWFAELPIIYYFAFSMLRDPRFLPLDWFRVILGLTVFLIVTGPAVTLTLLIAFCEGVMKVKYPLGYAIIPLLPLILSVLVFLVSLSLNIIFRLINASDLYHTERIMDTPLQLGLNIGSLFSSIVTFALLIFLVLQGFLEQSVIQSVPIIFQFALIDLLLHGLSLSEIILFFESIKKLRNGGQAVTSV